MKNPIYSLVFLALSVSLPVYPVYQFAQRNIPRFFTGVHWLIAAGPCWCIGALTVYCNTNPEFCRKVYGAKPFNEEEKEFLLLCNQTIAQAAPHAKQLPAVFSNSKMDGVAIPACNAVYIHHTYLEKYSNARKKKDFQELRKIENDLKFLLGHEVRHLENKDVQSFAVVAGILPVFTHYFFRTVSPAILTKKKVDAPKVAQLLLKNSMRIPTGLGKFFTSFVLFSYFRAYREYRADIESGELLGCEPTRHGAEFFHRVDLDDDNAIKRRVEDIEGVSERNKDLITLMLQKLHQSNITYPIIGFHPSHCSRARYLEALADQLKNEDDQS